MTKLLSRNQTPTRQSVQATVDALLKPRPSLKSVIASLQSAQKELRAYLDGTPYPEGEVLTTNGLLDLVIPLLQDELASRLTSH